MANVLKLNGSFKQLVLIFIDFILVGSAIYIALLLRFEGYIPPFFMNNFENLVLPLVLQNILIFAVCGIYRRLWRYAGVDELLLIVFAVTLGAAGNYLFSWLSGIMLPRSVYIIAWFLLILLLGGSRLSLRVLANYLQHGSGLNSNGSRPALIIGAGDAGVMVAGELKKHQGKMGLRPIGFIDDDPAKQRQVIHGLPVLGNSGELARVVEEKEVQEIIVAMPSAPYARLRQIVDCCRGFPVKMKTVPGLFEIINEQVSISNLREVQIEDLLGREPVEVDITEIAGYLEDKVVAITGAGGSIGGELCRQVAGLAPRQLVLLDHDENGMFYIHRELQQQFPDLQIIPLVRGIEDRRALQSFFEHYTPQVIFHAAAYKHVPLMETNAIEAVYNNVMGTKNLMDLAEQHGVERFVMISSDKAVNPSNVMGATKRATEVYMQYKARSSNCVFCTVRFGNVLGSRGSVIPLFREQIAAGGPVTVTHPKMTRYFMTIPEAVQLVIQAGAFGKRGEIFVLDMGQPVRIVDLARDMILLSGLQPGRDIEIEFTGIRPGEKLYEELFNEKESFLKTKHARIFIAPQILEKEEDFLFELGLIEPLLNVDLAALMGISSNDNFDTGQPYSNFINGRIVR